MTQQFFISVEQSLMIECSNIVAAIFVAHYIFNLSYHRKAGDVWLFVQEKVFGLPSKAGIRRNPSTISHFSGIARRYDSISSVEPLAPESWSRHYKLMTLQYNLMNIVGWVKLTIASIAFIFCSFHRRIVLLYTVFMTQCVLFWRDAVCGNVVYVYSTQIMIVKVTPSHKHLTNSCAKVTQVTSIVTISKTHS